MSNIEIVSEFLVDGQHLPALRGVRLSKHSTETQVEILTRVRFVSLSVLNALNSYICAMGARVREILVSPIPPKNNRLKIIIVFRTN